MNLEARKAAPIGRVAKWVAPLLAGMTLISVLVIAGLVHLQYGDGRDRVLQAAAERLERRIDAQLVLLAAVKGVMIAHGGPITSAELTAFLEALPEDAGAHGALGFGLALAVPPDQPGIARAVAGRSVSDAREPWPATDQPVRFPIVVLAPPDESNRRAMSYDMYSEPLRRDAMRRAAVRRAAAATAPVRLVQDERPDQGAGTLIYLPVFRGEKFATPTPPEAIPGDVLGYVYAPLRAGDLVRRVLEEPPVMRLAVSVTDVTGGANALLWATEPGAGRTMLREVDVADRRWRIELREPVEPAIFQNPALAILLLGGGMAALFVLLGRAHLRSIADADRLARATQARAELAEVMLGEMRHRIKNSIARKLALFRLSVREAPDKDSLARVFEARMQALARAQDLLLAPPQEGLTVRHLVDEEVAEWSSAAADIRIDGPDVHLDGPQLQALALIIHEMTTNSLKYGALGAQGQLDIVWSVTTAEGGAHVILEWRERGVTQAAPVRQEKAGPPTGYGSRLIRLMAEGELGGVVERRLENGSLTLSLAFPLKRRAPA